MSREQNVNSFTSLLDDERHSSADEQTLFFRIIFVGNSASVKNDVRYCGIEPNNDDYMMTSQFKPISNLGYMN